MPKLSFPQRLTSALIAAGFSDRYYKLCKTYRSFRGTCKCPHPEVMKALEGIGDVKKLSGPGRVYSVRIPDQSNGMDFGFVIQSGATVELGLSFDDLEIPRGSNFAVLAFYVSQVAGKPDPRPPYPRPNFISPSELREIVRVGFELSIDVARHVYA